MNCLYRFVLFGFSCCFLPTFPLLAQDSPAPTPETHVKKVWTNEDYPSTRGNASSSGGWSRHSSRSGISASNGATFLNPKEGEIVHPGETIHIDLRDDSGFKPAKAVGIVSTLGASSEFREGPPYSFTLNVPEGEIRGNGGPLTLIGFHQLTLFGTVVGRKDSDLAITTVDVEEADLPISFFTTGPAISRHDKVPNHVKFYRTGQDVPVFIFAEFPNGHKLEVTQSAYLSFASENPAIAFVDEEGNIASVAPGETRILVTYALSGEQKQFAIPVSVPSGSEPIEISPTLFDFGEVASNTKSAPLEITVKNHTTMDVQITRLEPQGSFLITSENCSNTVLSPNGSCTISAVFTPIRPGHVHSNIYLNNSYNGVLIVSLFGDGT
jgi:hypothetical protein